MAASTAVLTVGACRDDVLDHLGTSSGLRGG